jgi:hypothetical protein
MLLAFFFSLLIDPPVALNVPAPELEKVTAWINGPGFKLAEQKGKVIVVHFFAFG